MLGLPSPQSNPFQFLLRHGLHHAAFQVHTSVIRQLKEQLQKHEHK